MTYLNTPLKERLYVLSTKVDPSRNTPDQIQVYLDELISLTAQAYEKKDFNFFGACVDVTRKLCMACFGCLPVRHDLAEKFMEHFKLETNVFIDFFTVDYLSIPHEVGDSIFSHMVANVLKHQSYYDKERPRLAGQMLEAVLGEARTVEPSLALFKAVVLSNTDNFCGSSHVIRALAEVQKERPKVLEFLHNFIEMAAHGVDINILMGQADETQTKLNKISVVSEAIIAWARDHQNLIAESIKVGPVSEWIGDSVVESALAMNLPVVAQALAIRSTDFTFSIMSALYEESGVFSDEKHLATVMKYPANNADVIAFSLVHQDILFDIDASQDIVMLVGNALDKIGDKPFNLLCIHTVVGKLVAKLKPSADVTDMVESRLGPQLKRHRKFNGIQLDNEIGL